MVSFALAYLIWTIVCLEINVHKARALDVPVVRIPVDPVNFSNSAVRLGPVWALATPVTFYLQIAEPDGIGELFSRRSDSIRPVKNYRWDDWERHRKALAAPFNESVMRFVWGESLRQATAMLRSWTGATRRVAGIPSVQKGTRTLSLNVLAATEFRKSYDSHGSADPAAQDEAGSYRNDLQTVLDNAILIMPIPPGSGAFVRALDVHERELVAQPTSKESKDGIKVGEQTLVVPPGVGTSPNLLAMHTHPKYWKDPFEWKPARWIVAGRRPESDSVMPGEQLWTPVAHTYFPWSDGPQNCPGAKFSKAEAVAVLACLFRAHRLGIKKEPGEGEEVARNRITGCINDVHQEILLRM
ncbi:hypothetical protein SLS53_003283 [Cytospora paraplurivora]|uniref:Cytochrome P450 n=1 Tax=Cytospora paraplurivora TaxID=2898453 RepID=A0AAN9UCF5_9PEZI